MTINKSTLLNFLNKIWAGKKIGLTTLILFAAGINSTFAANLEWSADTNYNLSSSGITIKVISGSKADSLIVGTSTITVSITAPDTFTIRSDNRYNLSNDAGAAFTCGSTYSELVISTSGTVVVTPTANICDESANTSGSGGGGDNQPPQNGRIVINDDVATTTKSNVTLSLSATDNVGVTGIRLSNNPSFAGSVQEPYKITRDWTLNSGNGIKTVYVRFYDAIGNASEVYSDTITLTAADVAPAPAPTPAPAPAPAPSPIPTPIITTDDQIAYLQAQIKALIEAIKLLQAGESGQIPKGILTKGLTIGSKGNEVTVLQNFLRAQGKDIYPEALVTGYFGPATRRAVQRFQIKFGLAKSGDRGYGYVGPKTRAMINELNK